MKTGSRTEQASSELQLNSPPYRAARGQGSLLAFTIFTAYIQLQNKRWRKHGGGGGTREKVLGSILYQCEALAAELH